MGIFHRKSKIGHVYAGPAPISEKKKEEFEMVDVYAGPEQMEQSQPPKLKQANTKPSQKNDAMMCAVYAGPDMLEQLRMNREGPNPLEGQFQYPFNYATNGQAVQGNKANEEIICPSCGERNRCGKFCVCCGMTLKDGSKE